MVPGEVRVNRWLDNGSLLLQSIGQVSNVALEDSSTVTHGTHGTHNLCANGVGKLRARARRSSININFVNVP